MKSQAPRSSLLSSGHQTGLLSSGHQTGLLSSGHQTGFDAIRGGISNAMGGMGFGRGSAQDAAGGGGGLGGQMNLNLGGLDGIGNGMAGMAAGWGLPTSFLAEVESQTGMMMDGLSGTASSMLSNWGSKAAGAASSAMSAGAEAASGLLPW